MTLSFSETDTGFEYIWQPEWLDPDAGHWRWAFSGTDLQFDKDGVWVSGLMTDYSIYAEYEVGGAAFSTERVHGESLTLDFSPIIASVEHVTQIFGKVLSDSLSAHHTLAPNQDGPHAYSWFTGEVDVDLRGTQAAERFGLFSEGGILRAGGGDDLVGFSHMSGRCFANLGAGDDTFGAHGAGAARVWGGAGNDTLRGGVSEDKLIGGAGRDSLSGGDGDDIIMGGAGRDNLFAGPGNDRLWGGEGGDAFVFNVDRYYWHDPQVGHNRVMDFDLSEDKLRLGPSDNGTWNADVALQKFRDGAEARSWGTVFKEDGMNIYLIGVALEDLTEDHFVNGSTAGSYDDWLYA